MDDAQNPTPLWARPTSGDADAPQPASAPTPAPAAAARTRRRPGLAVVSSVLAGGVLALGVAASAPSGSVALPTVGSSRTAPATGTPTRPWSPDAQPGSDSGDSSGTSGSTSSGSTRATAQQSAGVVLIGSATPSGEAAGTGMVLTASGRVLTNYHVVESSTDIQVTVATTGTTYAATVVGHDATRDVALLQLEKATNLTTIRPDDDPISAGDAVTAVGNAQGQGYLTSATGTITETRTTVTVASDNAAGSERLADVMATDAAAQPGDSGGPMFDAEGEVAGMTTAGGTSGVRRTSVTTTSFAIDIDDALAVVQTIEGGHDSGTVEVGPRAYLGITVGAPTSAESGDGGSGYGGSAGSGSAGSGSAGSGVPVDSVEDGTPAADAGLTSGDTITAVNGTEVSSQAELAAVLERLEPGDRVAVTWEAIDGQRHSGTVTLGTSPIN